MNFSLLIHIFSIAAFTMNLSTGFFLVLKRSLSSQSSVRSTAPSMDDIVRLCKKKGFVFQSSEIYGPMSGLFDFGPLGVEMKSNIKRLWWRDMVQRRDNVVGIDCSIISSPQIWQASGHVEGFSDPMVDCKESKLRFRADQVFWSPIETVDGEILSYITVQESENMEKEALSFANKILKKLNKTTAIKSLKLVELTKAPLEIYNLLPSPATGNPGQLTLPREFNLMFQTNVGAITEESNVTYLRPETAQGIFTNFQSVQRSSRLKIPFGIAQIGKSFRNELTPKNFIFRSREFEQMEIEYFISPDENEWKPSYKDWISVFLTWLREIGIREELLTLQEHESSNLAHYARACTDIKFQYPFGIHELMGIAARGDFDLKQHSTHSGKLLEYHDPSTNLKYIPHVIEPSIGVERLFLALLCSAYREEVVENEKRVVLALHPAIAPIKACILPLVSNKPEIAKFSKEIYDSLKTRFMVEYDSSGAIGRRYRRADESGTPFCITVDFDSLNDNSVTIRMRDSMQQLRLPSEELIGFLSKEIGFY